MVRMGREVRSRMDSVLGKYRRLFRNIFVWDIWHNSDHYLVLGCLRSTTLMEHTQYFRRIMRIPLRPL